MSRVAYVNGSYVPHAYATTHVEDRGYQFSDGVYEVICLMHGRLLDEEPHYDRLDFSLGELQIPQPCPRQSLQVIVEEIVRRNRLQEGMVYIQVSRGVAPRNHPFPTDTKPILVVTARHFDHQKFQTVRSTGVKVISLIDGRWNRPDIKSVSLLPNILGKQKAIEAGAFESILINDKGHVTESNATNVWIVNAQGKLQTHPAGSEILNGITRQRLIQIAGERRLPILETPFTMQEMIRAREAFLSASVTGIVPIVQVDEHIIASKKVGDITQQLQNHYANFARQD